MIKNLFLFVFLITVVNLQAQTVFGKWKTFNDDTGKPNSIIEIYKKDGEVYGKVVRILHKDHRNRRCNDCSGKLKDQPIEGLELMSGLQKSGNEYKGGFITDPETGKEYRCKIWLDKNDPDKLMVRGYIAFLYRTQIWERVK